MTTDPGCPYKGLASYEDSEVDVQFFFGREGEREIICANLMASKLTVLYGETGVGKSSVLRAGVAHSLRSRGDALGVVVFDAWKDDPAAGLVAALAASAGVDPRATLADTLEACSAKLDGDFYVILDGVEEYFLYHEGETGPGTFFSELPEAIKRSGLRASFLLAIREDALAKLDRFKAGIPNLFGNYLRLAHLDREAAKIAILSPVDRYNDLVDASRRVEVEPALAEAVLDEVVAGRVDLGQAGRGVVAGTQADDRIEAPYLQLVMRRLWEAEEEAGSQTLRVSTLVALGGAEEIVRAHLARALEPLTGEQQDTAAAVFNHLVTPSGTKIAHAAPDLARYAGVGETELEPVLATLARERILRPAAADGGAPRFEIYHDVLSEAVLAWRAEHERFQELEQNRAQAAKRHRRLVGVIAAGSVLLALMAGITVFALVQRSEAQRHAREASAARSDAQRRAREANARRLSTAAVSLLEQDPQLSLQLAREAVRRVPSLESETILRASLIAARERAVLSAGGRVTAATYSRDGQLILTGSRDGRARVYRAGRTAPLHTMEHGAPILDARFDSGGRLAVTAGQDGTARVWSTRNGSPVRAFEHGAPVRSASFNRRGTMLVTAGGRSAKLWRSSGQLVRQFPWTRPVLGAAFSPDGSLVAVFGRDRVVRLYSTTTRELERSLNQGGRVTSVEFSPERGLLATTGTNGTARIWRVDTGELVRELSGHTDQVLDVAFSPRAGSVATASADGTARIWNALTGELASTVATHRNPVTAVAFSPDGNFVATASSDRTARVSKVDIGDLRALLAGHRESVTGVEFSPDGSRVLTAGDDATARIWDPRVQPQLAPVATFRGPVLEAAYVAPGNRMLVTGPGRSARLVASGNGQVERTFTIDDPVTAAAASPDGKLVGVAGGKRVVLFRADGSRGAILAHPAAVTSVAFLPDGDIATGDRRGTARIWDAAGRVTRTLRGGRKPITDIGTSLGGDRVALASQDGNVRIFAAASGSLERALTEHDAAVTSVMFSPDGKLILTASRDHDARLWNTRTGARVQVLRRHLGPVADATFSPDGRWIVTAGPLSVLLWRPGISEPVLPYGFGGNTALLTSAIFDPSGKHVLSTAVDGTVRRAACGVCGGREELLALVDAQLARVGRKLTAAERNRYGLD